MNKTELLNKCARSGEERVLLARALDKLELAQNRSVPACTPFLSPGEQASVTDLLNAWGRPRHLFFGGYEGAERAVCAFLPDWQEESDFLADPEGPVAALEAAFPADAELSHRDILGAPDGTGHHPGKAGGHPVRPWPLSGAGPAGCPAHPPLPSGSLPAAGR